MSPVNMRVMLGLVLLVTIVAAWLSPEPDANSVTLNPKAAIRQKNVPGSIAVATNKNHAETPVDVLNIHPRDLSEDGEPDEIGLFSSTQWSATNKPIPIIVSAPSVITPPPQAPLLPFNVLGKYVDTNGAVIFLQHNDQNLVVRVGDTIADQYKVESLTGSTLTLRYLPLNQLQTLAVGSTQ